MQCHQTYFSKQLKIIKNLINSAAAFSTLLPFFSRMRYNYDTSSPSAEACFTLFFIISLDIANIIYSGIESVVGY
jgi:hypothetical protein